VKLLGIAGLRCDDGALQRDQQLDSGIRNPEQRFGRWPSWQPKQDDGVATPGGDRILDVVDDSHGLIELPQAGLYVREIPLRHPGVRGAGLERILEREWEQRLTDVRAAERTVAEVTAKRPDPLADQEIAWCRRAGADLRKVFDAPTTTDRERKQLLRAILTDVVVTVDRESEQHTADLRVVWDGGQVTEHNVPLLRTGSHTRCTDQDTIALVRQLAERYPDKQIAAILARQGRRTGAGNPFTAHNVHGLRTYHQIPAAPVRATTHDGEMVTIAKAADELDVSTATVHRWLREGFITGEQITPGAPWQIQLTDELRARIREQAPDGWLALTQAARALGVARQTVLHKVQRGELAAVYVHRGKRKGLRIQVTPDQTGLFENHIRKETQC